MKWTALSDTIPHTLDELQAVLAANRGITDIEEFLSPTHPLELTLDQLSIERQQMLRLISLLEAAQKEKQPIIVFGDYDADGISATAILWQTLHHLGFDAKPFIPHREQHGYGVSLAAIAELESQGWIGASAATQPLLITVDTGIVAHEGVAALNKLGVTVVITDHHVAESKLPSAAAVVHTTRLCGASVSWIVAREIQAAFGDIITDEWWQLDLAGLATIADQVPILDANRSFAWWGIGALRQTKRPGLLALLKQAGVEQSQLDESTVNYVLAPRLNAMGRLAHSLEGLRLVCTKSVARAEDIAASVDGVNSQRQVLTEDLVRIALSSQKDWEDKPLIVVASPAYHEGVIGLVAGKLAEQFHKPAIVIAVGETKAKGSARSVAGINIIEFLRENRNLFTELGGHPMAAGFGLPADKVAAAIAGLEEAGRNLEIQEPSIEVECVLPAELQTLEAVEVINQFRPFGQRNPMPHFLLEKLTVKEHSLMGKNKQHLKIIAHNGLTEIEMVKWNGGETVLEKEHQITTISKLKISSWKKKQSLQTQIISISL